MSKVIQDDAKLGAMGAEPVEGNPDDSGDWNKYIELLTPTIIKKSVATGIKVKSDMVDTLNWLNTKSVEQQQSLVALATGAVSMTKEAVSALSATTAKEYERISVSLTEQGLSRTVRGTASKTFTNAQELYEAAMSTATSITDDVTAKAKLKREEVLASEALVAARGWAEAVKKAIEENLIVTNSKAIGGDALKLAEESYNKALQYAERQRVDTINLTLMYLAAAQDQMSGLNMSEQGTKLGERTQRLINIVRSMPGELQLLKSAERLDMKWNQAVEIAKYAEDWVSAVLGYQKEGDASDDKRVAAQFDLVEALENEV